VDQRPVTRYAIAPDGVSIAYQVTGDGPLDVVWMSALSYPIDLLWEEPGFAHAVKRLRGFSRTVWYEGRGWGASGGSYLDRVIEEVAAGDLTAVLEGTEAEQVVLVGWSLTGTWAVSYAAAHPERVKALVLIDTHAHYVREVDYPLGFPLDALESLIRALGEQWGSGATVETLAPSKADDSMFRERVARYERLGTSPDQVAKGSRLACLRDVRHLLPSVSVPTLVIHRGADRFIRADAGRYLAEHIPGAKYVELPGDDHLFFVGDADAILDEIEDFLTGTHQAPEGDVVTATVLFTDIVASTEQAARMGHRKWNSLTHDHDAMVRATLTRHRGREVKTMGDGFLATFDATSRAVRAAIEILTGAKGWVWT
jgi:pimeloyl-ACP methyl ester carboxylesterase